MTSPRAVAVVRRGWERTPLWGRLVAGLLVLLTATLALSGLVGTRLLRGYLIGRVDSQLQATLDRATHSPDGLNDIANPPREGFRVRNPTVVGLAAANGSSIDWAPQGSDDPLPAFPRLTRDQAATRVGKAFSVGSVAGSDHRWRMAVEPVVVSPSGQPVTLVVATDVSSELATVHRLAVIDALFGGIALLMLAGAGYLVVRAALRPLDEIEETAAAIAAGDLSRRVPQGDPRTEVGRLARALNGMLAQIERAFGERAASEEAARRSEERMRRFVADASHELRTPLTSIRGFAELHRQGAVADPSDVSRLLRRIEDEARRMGLLVDDLLLLARLDQQRPLESREVDVLLLATDAVQDAAMLAPQRSVSLELLPPAGPLPPLVVRGDEGRLRQVIGNLMTNALTHTPQGTPVQLRVGTRPQFPGSVVVEVADQGPGLAPDQAERVFERFYRAEASRVRTSGGTGLGLAIVVALVEAHGGRITVESTPGHGATFRVVLPLAGVPAGTPEATDLDDAELNATDREAATSEADDSEPVAAAEADRAAEPSPDTATPAVDAVDSGRALEVEPGRL